MKYKSFTIGLLALTLVAVTLIPTVFAAADAYVYVTKQGKYRTFSIDPYYSIDPDGTLVDTTMPTSLTFNYVAKNDKTSTIQYFVLDEGLVVKSLTEAGDPCWAITIVKQDLPVTHATFTMDVVLDNGLTFTADGPAWGWGGFHK